MSALDFGAGTGTNATPRYYTFTGPALPNSDWCIGIWHRRTQITGANTQFLFAIGTNEAANSMYAYVGETTNGFKWGTAGFNSAGVELINTASAGANTQDGLDYLMVVQRRSNVIEVAVVQEGTSATIAFTTSTITGATTSQASKIGYGGYDPARIPVGEFFIYTDRSLSTAQITTLAAGARPGTANIGADPLVMLAFRSGEVATETNLGTGGATYNATQVSSGFTTTTDFFSIATVTGFDILNTADDKYNVGEWPAVAGGTPKDICADRLTRTAEELVLVGGGGGGEVAYTFQS